MKSFAFAVLTLVSLACAAATQQLPMATAALVNPGFDEPGNGVPGWAERGNQYGSARVVKDPVASAPGAVELAARGRGSMGNDSFMLYQVLDPAPYRGRRVTFGAKVRTAGGAVNITLYTPEGIANDFFQTLETDRFVDRQATLDVPANASFLSFGIQIMGPAGARAYLDDAFVRVEGADAARPAAAAGKSDPQAEVTIDATRPGSVISPLIFGMHLEWADAGNGIVDRRTGQLRSNVVDALKGLRVPLFRYPGGIHADYYDWRTGIGPRERRSDARNVFTGQDEPHLFGTPEFIELLKATGAQPLITANYGTGSAQDAAEWARYFRDAGVDVRYWEVGNEIYLADPDRDQPNGRRIAKDAEAYANDFPRFREAIRGVVNDAQVGLIAHLDTGAFPLAPASRRDWTNRVLRSLKTRPDFVAVHNAYAPVVINDSVRFDRGDARQRAYRAMYAAPLQIAEDLSAMAALLDERPETRGLPIGVTEWGPLFGYSNRQNVHSWYVDQSRTMAAGVYVASALSTFASVDRVLLATYTNPIHRWYGSLLTDTERGLIQTPSYHVFSLFRTRFESRRLTAAVESPTFDAESVGLVKAHRAVPELVAAASMAEDGRRLTAILTNRSLQRTLTTRLQIRGFEAGQADCMVLAAPAPNAINGPGLTNSTATGATIAPQRLDCAAGTTMSISVPASAVVSVVLQRR